jgi:nucleotide-binding universal stress UspA family protein
MARWTRQRLILAHAVPATDVEQATEDLADVARRLDDEGVLVDVTCPVLPVKDREAVAHAILAQVRAQDGRFVVMSTHGWSGLGRWLYGSVTEQVLQHAHVPLILVTASCDRSWPDEPPLRILVPLDGSDTAEAILSPLRELMVLVPVELYLTRVVASPASDVILTYPMPSPYLTRDFQHSDAGAQEVLDGAWGYLDEVADSFRDISRAVDVQVSAGHAAPLIAKLVRERDVHLVAMATHGRTGLARTVLGSTAIGLLHRTDVPLLLVRPSGLHHARSED